MPEIIAIGNATQRQCRCVLHDGQQTLLGRAPRSGWAVPWDRLISREHARLSLDDGRLKIEALETARNPIYLDGAPQREFEIVGGQEFRIGDTTFHFQGEDESELGDSVVAEHVFGDDVLTSERFTSPSSCLHALCKMPELIGRYRTDEELAEQVVELLLESVRGAMAASVMRYEGPPGATVSDPKLIRWNSRNDQVAGFRPSQRLVRRAMERQQSVVHLWMGGPADGGEEFTLNNDLDWAFCTPIPIGANERWCFYVSGQRRFAGMREVDSPKDLIGELRTAELVAKFVGAVRQVRVLEQQHTEMRRFFSPAVIETLADDPTTDVLQPRSGPVSVLFCDVRGFSRKVEAAVDLHALLKQVSQALSVMTRSILKFEGVIADFQGDAALGFWGWPSANDEAALLACRAALLIHERFSIAENEPSHPLHGFRVGIGIGHGQAIAGRIGAQEQIKVGVFGPVVNLASRLQEFTKQVGAPILLDGTTARAAGDMLRGVDASLRRMGLFRPVGIESPVEVYALDTHTPLAPDQLATCDAAVQAIERGEWSQAMGLLKTLPDGDKPASFLRAVLSKAGPAPPYDWDGVLAVDREGGVRFRTGKTTRVTKQGGD